MIGKKNKVIIATRGSKLALWQADWVKTQLEKRHLNIKIELNKIKTTGDKIIDVPLAKVGGKGLFVKEIEEALLRRDADLAVHSMKDVPVDLPPGLHITAICKREDPRDVLIISKKTEDKKIRKWEDKNLSTSQLLNFSTSQSLNSELNYSHSRHSLLYDLPHGARVGTSSLRRICQLSNIRPDLEIVQLRGNLDTRIRKLDEGQFDAIIVAVAGVKRLGMAERITETLEPDVSLSAIGQGAIGIECRVGDEFINDLLKPLNHIETSICVRAERAFLKKLGGGCQVPIAAYARIEHRTQSTPSLTLPPRGGGQGGGEELRTLNSKLIIDGLVGSVSGDKIIRGSIEGMPDNAEHLGAELAEDLISRGAGEILAEVYKR
jgi:hydroxymethylbilane synthase